MKDNQQPKPKSPVYTVYRLTNTITGLSYIGLTTVGLHGRWLSHLNRVREGKRKSRIYRALTDYGPPAFEREQLAQTLSKVEGERLEAFYIKKFDTYLNGYNSNWGGSGFAEFPDEIKRKISAAQKGKIIPPETREKMAAAKRGDKSLALRFGDRRKHYLIRFPDGSEHVIFGLKDFCKVHKLTQCKLSANGRTKGYVILRRLIDYSERKYGQAAGNGGSPNALQGKDIVSSRQ